MKNSKRFKKLKNKYYNGVKQIAVPEVGTNIDNMAMTGAFAGANTGGQLGSFFGPQGQIIGTVLGGSIGAIGANSEAKRLLVEEEFAKKDAIRKNNTYQDLNIGNINIDPKLQSFAKGTRAIEIEAKETPEIHTDRNFNIKNLGDKPHASGGTKVLAEDGDVVFDTQNSKEKYTKIMNDIRKTKFGDPLAKKRLEKERDSLPKDSADKEKMWTGNEGVEVNVANSDLTYGFSPKSPIFTPGIDTSALNQKASAMPTNAGTNQFSTLSPSDIIIPKGTTTATSVGAKPQATPPVEKTDSSFDLSNLGGKLSGIGKLASPLYKFMKSKENVSKPSEIPLSLQKMEYKDTSDIDRAEVDSQRRAMEMQVNRSGLSRGQALGRLAQTSTQAIKQKGEINERERRIKQNIDAQNVNLTNQERTNLLEQQVRNQDVVRRAEAQKESYLGEAMKDFTNLSQTSEQMNYMKSRDKKGDEMNEKTLKLIESTDYKLNPETWEVEIKEAISKEKDPVVKKQLEEALAEKTKYKSKFNFQFNKLKKPKLIDNGN